MIDPGQCDRVLLSIEGFTPLLYSPVGLDIKLPKKGPKRLPEVITSGARVATGFRAFLRPFLPALGRALQGSTVRG